ncbi:MAG: tripartite tricarboxylate transporter substrate binding protein [Betaproteobacteria bacterium]
MTTDQAAALSIGFLAVLFVPGAHGQGWKPERNVELIVPASAGGSLDTTGRTVQRLWDELKLLPVSSTVANRSGGGHAVAYNFLNQRAGDPHYMSITSSTLHTSNINGRTPLSYREFTPLTVLLTEYIAFAVRTDSPLKTGKDLIEALRKTPGSFSIALSSALGGTHHISLGLPLQSAKIDLTQTKLVAFNSTGEAVTALLGGHVDVMNGGTVQIAPHVESGKMRVLAVTSAKRLPGPLSVGPTWPELGYKGVFENWRGVIGTKGMTADQISFWESAFRRIVESGEFRRLAEKNQWDANFKTAAETRKFMESQYGELKEVMTFLGLAK